MISHRPFFFFLTSTVRKEELPGYFIELIISLICDIRGSLSLLMSSEQGNSKGEIHGLFVGRGVHLGKVAPCLQGMGSESSVQMKLPAGFWAGFLAAESLQIVICASRAGSITGCYVLVPEIWMVFCGNLGGNNLVVSPSQEISQEVSLLFKWILGGLIGWFFFLWMLLLVWVHLYKHSANSSLP